MKQPYKYWTRSELFKHLEEQAVRKGINVPMVKRAVYSDDWNPLEDYNGCNFVQDDLHPFLPCFIHDWRWICFEYHKKFDWEFEENLIKFGYPSWKANLYYIMVRLGWIFYYQFKKKYGS